MRVKIQKSMLLVICITMIVVFALSVTLDYVQTSRTMKGELKQEAIYIRTAVDRMGMTCLSDMDKAQKETRLTVVTPEGEVLYDSGQDGAEIENHGERKEIKDALTYGSGQEVRKSSTVGKQMFYYATLLSDGNVLRVSKTTDTIWHKVLLFLPYMCAIALVMIIVAYFLAKWQTARLIKPINTLNLEEPLQNDVYEELTPLLHSIDNQNKAKEEAANMRKEFSANVSHELKTPLTSISGYAEIMKSGLVRPEDMIGFSEKIYNEASRLIVLIEDIIKLSKLDEASVEAEKEEVDLFALSREICSRLALQAEKKNVHIEVTGEEVFCSGIKRILDEMIYNICENAIKYNREGGRVTVWAGNTLNGPKVRVTDTGIGIPEEEWERIFERFYRVDKSHSKESGGTGLGLSIVKHGAILHHADIRVESKVGEGTRMELLFGKKEK